eukprot:s1391_g10.t2
MLRGQAWWWNITNLGAQMKDLMVTDDPASSPRSSVGNSPRPGTAGTGSKVPSVRGEPDVTFKEELPESTLKRAAKVAACTPKLERRFGTADLSSSTAGMKRKPPEPSISPARLRRCWRFLHQEVRAQTAPGNVGQTPKLMGMDSRLRAISAVHKASETVAVDTSQDVGKLQPRMGGAPLSARQLCSFALLAPGGAEYVTDSSAPQVLWLSASAFLHVSDAFRITARKQALSAQLTPCLQIWAAATARSPQQLAHASRRRRTQRRAVAAARMGSSPERQPWISSAPCACSAFRTPRSRLHRPTRNRSTRSPTLPLAFQWRALRQRIT